MESRIDKLTEMNREYNILLKDIEKFSKMKNYVFNLEIYDSYKDSTRFYSDKKDMYFSPYKGVAQELKDWLLMQLTERKNELHRELKKYFKDIT